MRRTCIIDKTLCRVPLHVQGWCDAQQSSKILTDFPHIFFLLLFSSSHFPHCSFPAAGGAQESTGAAGFPAAKRKPADAAAAEVLEPGEECPDAGIPAAQADPAAGQPEATLAAQAVEARQEV